MKETAHARAPIVVRIFYAHYANCTINFTMYAVYYGQELALLALITRAPEDRRRRRRYLTKRTLAEAWLKSEEKKKKKCPFWKRKWKRRARERSEKRRKGS